MLNIKNFADRTNKEGYDGNYTSAIQRAVNKLTQFGGGIIYVPQGIYRVSNIVIDNKYFFMLVGEGQGSIIYNDSDTDSFVISNSERWAVKNLTINGNGQNGPHGAGATTLNGINIISCGNFCIDNVATFYHGKNGISLSGSSNVASFINCISNHNLGDGLNARSLNGSVQNGNNLSIINSALCSNNASGLSWGAVSLNVNGSAFENNNKSGIEISTNGVDYSPRSASITGNYIEGNKEAQIKFETTNTNEIRSVYINGNYFNTFNSFDDVSNGIGGEMIKYVGVKESFKSIEVGIANEFNYSG